MAFEFHDRTQEEREPSLAGRILATFFFGLFLGLGLFFTFMTARLFEEAVATYRWEARRCEIVSSEVVRFDGEKPYRPVIEYRATDDLGKLSADPERTRIRLDGLFYGSFGEAFVWAEKYPQGAIVHCYVSKEGKSVLERGPLWMGFWVVFSLIFVGIGGVGLYATWKPERRDRLGRQMPVALAPSSRSAAPKKKQRIFLGIGGTILALGLFLAWMLAIRPLSSYLAARSWDAETCTVEQSSVLSHSSDDGTTYSIDILYRWDRGRGLERSSRYSFFGGASSGRAGKKAVVDRYPRGAEVACWVDPVRANEAVLERELTGEAWLAAIPVGLLAIGLGFLHFGMRQRRAEQSLREGARLGHLPMGEGDPVLDALPAFEVAPGPIRLAPSWSRWGRLAGIVAAAIFWNGIVAVFANQVWQSWHRGEHDTFLMIFLTPFVLVGIGLVLAIGYSILALANPIPVLIVSARHVGLGDSLALRWKLESGADRRIASIASFRIELEGREEATYQVGTNSHTAREVFYKEELLRTSGSHCAAGGQLSLAIPAETMHSFESSHNKIVWEIQVRGEIPRWPDISESYALVVLPQSETVRKRRSRAPGDERGGFGA